MTDGWIPRTTLEKLIQIDTLLSEVVPNFGKARERIVDTLPGHSGRPAGSGEPSGGRSGGHGATIVERTFATWDRDVADLDQLDGLAEAVVARLASWFPSSAGPIDNGAVRRLAWARWCIQQITRTGARFNGRQLMALHRDAEQLHRKVMIWAGPREATDVRSPSLAADMTNSLCRSCLRAGVRNLRSDRYTTDGLCRWCGDFRGEQGFLPTLVIIDAHQTGAPGSTIAKMIRDERKATTPAPSKRKRRRGR